eukprot:m.35740 g.35740  ORF g.35740 m.35740 type:complete len:1056 (+) comp5354_c0_seq1:167-3334(+)
MMLCTTKPVSAQIAAMRGQWCAVLLCALLSGAGADSILNNGVVGVVFGSGSHGITAIFARTETAAVLYNISGDDWQVTVAPSLDSTTSQTLGPAQCPQQGITANSTHVVVQFGGGSCFPYAVQATYELQPEWHFATKTLLIYPASESISFSVLEVIPFSSLRVQSGGADGDAPFVAINPFDTGKHLGSFHRFPLGGGGLFTTVQNPFTTFTAVPNTTTACQWGIDRPNGDEPGMPLAMSVSDADACAYICSADPNCKAYAFIPGGCHQSDSAVCFRKSTVEPTASVPTCMCSGLRSDHAEPPYALTAAYAPRMSWSAWPAPRTPGHISDAAVFGVFNLTKYYIADTGLNTGERDAFSRCVEAFLLDNESRQAGTVKINVAWDENDYQIDVSTPYGVQQYQRIIDRNAQFGVTHIVFEPQDSLQSSRFNATDAWGWESGLWMTMGEQVREGRWDPQSMRLPSELQAIVDYAFAQNIRLCAYVYPVLAFAESSQWLFERDGRVWASLADESFQDWLSEALIAFANLTHGGGFAWDYTFFNDPRPGNEYSQWRGWMRVIEAVRAAFPDVVMDHRQLNHVYGPWYQKAGSYAEPIAGDENPETYGVPIHSLHTDHVAGDNMRIINYKYRQQQLQPMARVPGFIFHQTERSDSHGLSWTDLYLRDFDFMGHEYSLLASIASAGLNNVFAMIPARDVGEFTQMPEAVIEFIRDWLTWTDDNADILANVAPIVTLPTPRPGAIDGTAGFTSDGSKGAMFFFNPSPTPLQTTILLDESVGLPNATVGTHWKITELYPHAGKGVGVATWGDVITVGVYGGGAKVLSFTPIPTAPFQSMLLVNASGTVSINGGTLFIDGAVGQAGDPTVLNVLFQNSAPSAVILNGVRVEHFQTVPTQAYGFQTSINVRFAGDQFAPMQQIGAQAASFTGRGWYNASLNVPTRVGDQIAARQQAYPLNWSAEELTVSWLAPARPMLTLAFANPLNTLTLTLLVDGHPIPVTPAYNSRALAEPGCFLGFFADLSAVVKYGTLQSVALYVEQPLPAGGFLGLFLDNVAPELTTATEL